MKKIKDIVFFIEFHMKFFSMISLKCEAVVFYLLFNTVEANIGVKHGAIMRQWDKCVHEKAWYIFFNVIFFKQLIACLLANVGKRRRARLLIPKLCSETACSNVYANSGCKLSCSWSNGKSSGPVSECECSSSRSPYKVILRQRVQSRSPPSLSD